MRDDVQMLSHNLKAEMSTYIDQSMKQWEFEYRRDHSDAMKRFNDVLAMSKHILPKSTFNVSEIKLKIHTLNAISLLLYLANLAEAE